MGWGQVAFADHHLFLARAFSDSVSLLLLVSMPLNHSMELAWAKCLTSLQFPQSAPSMSIQRLQGQITTGKG